MKWIYAVALLAVALPVNAVAQQTNCSVPRIRTPENLTVTGYMMVKSGKRCSVSMTSSRGPIDGLKILANPAHGNLVTLRNRITYLPRAGYVGSDSFTYMRTGLDERGNPTTRTVRMQVTVAP